MGTRFEPFVRIYPLRGLVAGTRDMQGAGIALLLADRLAPEQRRPVGLNPSARPRRATKNVGLARKQ